MGILVFVAIWFAVSVVAGVLLGIAIHLMGKGPRSPGAVRKQDSAYLDIRVRLR